MEYRTERKGKVQGFNCRNGPCKIGICGVSSHIMHAQLKKITFKILYNEKIESTEATILHTISN